MNKNENIYSFKGIGKVYKFTILQAFKNKGYIFTFVLMVLMMSLSAPFQYMMSSIGEKTVADSSGINKDSISKIYILNETPVKFDGFETNVPQEKIEFLKSGEKTDQDIVDSIKDNEIGVIISLEDSSYKVKGVISNESKIESSDLSDLTSFISSEFDKAKVASSNIDKETKTKILNGMSTDEVITAEKFESSKVSTVVGTNYSMKMLGFSILIMVVISMSTSYIIASVTEEKQSKLVETLLVSVRPMALLMGKILGMMSYVLITIVFGFTGSLISRYIMENKLGADMSRAQGGIDFGIVTEFGPKGIIVFTLSTLIGFLTFAILGGIFGGACSKTEDVQNATGNIMTITMVAYFAAFISGMIDNPIINKIVALVPPFSFFTLPVQYGTNRVSLVEVILAIVIQFVVVVVLGMLCAKIYRVLILSDSSTPKLKTILKSLKA